MANPVNGDQLDRDSRKWGVMDSLARRRARVTLTDRQGPRGGGSARPRGPEMKNGRRKRRPFQGLANLAKEGRKWGGRQFGGKLDLLPVSKADWERIRFAGGSSRTHGLVVG